MSLVPTLDPNDQLDQLYKISDATMQDIGSFRTRYYRNFVKGEGPIGSKVMIVSDSPGELERVSGRPFMGPASEGLDLLLQEAGVSRCKSFITNLLKYQPYTEKGKKFSPLPIETRLSARLVTDEIRIVKPKIIVFMGKRPCEVIAPGVPYSTVLGRFWNVKGKHFLCTHNPAVLYQRSPEGFESAKEHFAQLKTVLQEDRVA